MIAILAAVGLAILAHLAPFPFLLDVTDDTIWRMPAADPPTIYLTFDDGPNPTATPQLLDVLALHGVRATFFVIDRHLTADTAPIVRRAFEEGHAVGLHSHTRAPMFYRPSRVSAMLRQAAARMGALTGHRPCPVFRPHAGHRSATLIKGAADAGHRVVGWGWLLWDVSWFRPRDADEIVPRVLDHASPGDIVVLHDGHHDDPRADRRYAVEAVDRLIPELRARGFQFGTICPPAGAV